MIFEQTRPNPYASVERGGIRLHFFGLRGYDPAQSISTCYVTTDDVDGLYEAFRRGLTKAFGKVPTKGIPRLGPLRNTTYGVRQFLVTDPGGNCIRVGQPIGSSFEHQPAPGEPVEKALHLAALLVDSKQDERGAERVLDRTLAAGGISPTRPQRLRMLVLRSDLHMRKGEAMPPPRC